MEEKNFNFVWLVRLCVNHWKFLGSILLLTVIVSSLVAVFGIESKYKSSVVLYPSTTNSPSQTLLIEHNPYRKDVLEFGEEEEAEQLLQILNSDEIRDSIINKFDLYSHYNINQDESLSKSTLHRIYNSSVGVKKTKFNSIDITVFDKDPNMASDLANEIPNQANIVNSRIRKKRGIQALHILENRRRLLYKARNLTQDSLSFYRKKGIISITAQTERLTEQYGIALRENNISGANRIQKKLDNLAKYAGYHDMLLRKSYEIEEELAYIEFETDRVIIDNQYSLENYFLVNKAKPAEKKSYPIRWLVVFASVMSVCVMTILFLCLKDYIVAVNDK
tara:strand:+ start:367 stop:1371 length:1005 start_codon:yes stop_codon:yes gene_type:complete